MTGNLGNCGCGNLVSNDDRAAAAAAAGLSGLGPAVPPPAAAALHSAIVTTIVATANEWRAGPVALSVMADDRLYMVITVVSQTDCNV